VLVGPKLGNGPITAIEWLPGASGAVWRCVGLMRARLPSSECRPAVFGQTVRARRLLEAFRGSPAAQPAGQVIGVKQSCEARSFAASPSCWAASPRLVEADDAVSRAAAGLGTRAAAANLQRLSTSTRGHCMETIIVIGVLSVLGAWCFKAGKRLGSRKGFGAGRFRRRQTRRPQ
jgi:hypothetical protein